MIIFFLFFFCLINCCGCYEAYSLCSHAQYWAGYVNPSVSTWAHYTWGQTGLLQSSISISSPVLKYKSLLTLMSPHGRRATQCSFALNLEVFQGLRCIFSTIGSFQEVGEEEGGGGGGGGARSVSAMASALTHALFRVTCVCDSRELVCWGAVLCVRTCR